MKNMFSICLLPLCFAIAAACDVTQIASQDRNRFVGAWRLAWLEQPGADGKLHRIDCCGMLVYTPDGHMSVQVMERNAQAQTPITPQQYSQGGYEPRTELTKWMKTPTRSLSTLKARLCGP
jgi:Lipocalin-like domain